MIVIYSLNWSIVVALQLQFYQKLSFCKNIEQVINKDETVISDLVIVPELDFIWLYFSVHTSMQLWCFI